MPHVLGRESDDGPTAALGHHRAPDGSVGAQVALDLDRPHAGLVVGKRGTGKSYTLGVVAEEIAAAAGVTGLVVDPMGAFDTLAAAKGVRVVDPRVSAGDLPPRAWCDVLDLDPASAVGSLLWRAADAGDSLVAMREAVATAEAPADVTRAAHNHLALAESWDVFGDEAAVSTWLDGGVTVLNLGGTSRPAANAVLRAVAAATYDAALAGSGPLPWLLVDEAHAFADGVAWDGLRTLLTRGRQPGVSVLLATQRPGALPEVAPSQADLVVAHRLTARTDLDALAAARPTYLRESLADRIPESPGEAVVLDDRTERVHDVSIRERETPHGGQSPRARRR
ncbi:MAG: ATP-binding protein [Halobacteriaceae archaeon]